MSNDIWLKRQAVADAYPGPRWAKKVEAMSDEQVVAVYLRLKKKGIVR